MDFKESTNCSDWPEQGSGVDLVGDAGKKDCQGKFKGEAQVSVTKTQRRHKVFERRIADWEPDYYYRS